MWHTVLETQILSGRLETVWEGEEDHTAQKREKHLQRGGSSGSRWLCSLIPRMCFVCESSDMDQGEGGWFPDTSRSMEVWLPQEKVKKIEWNTYVETRAQRASNQEVSGADMLLLKEFWVSGSMRIGDFMISRVHWEEMCVLHGKWVPLSG